MKKFLSFEEFVNEHYTADTNNQEVIDEAADDNFDPATASDVDTEVGTAKTASELKPGKEYVLTVDGKEHSNLMFQGVSDGVYIFNSEDQKTVLDFNEEEMNAVLSAAPAKEVQL
jgi:hypothetical protein